jgi:peptidyl-prolyl cis-trans isomerase SurA
MKIRLSHLIRLIIVLPVFCQAQDLNTRTLLTVDGSNTEAGEFMRMYKKSQEPGKTLHVDDYIRQFTLFKLKVADAVSEGYDTTVSFRNELNGYRNQLAQNYLTDTQAKDKLLRNSYKRSLTEINVWHILVAMQQDAPARDTLKAWRKANEIRTRILNGEAFEQVARSTSDDQSVRVNGGNLGYITVFQMIMPFEDAVYSMKKGSLSKPLRTPYGYHIIKVTDIRPSKGRIQVAHIMKNAPPGTTETDAKKAEEEINSIYNQLQNGASFSTMAMKYSDHKESALKGGVLDWFGTGEIIPAFSEAAFSIADTGDFSKPVRTIYGWHIIKLLNRKPPGSFEETSSYLESRINKSYLNSLSKKSFVEKLKKEYNFKIIKSSYDWFIQHTDTLTIQGLKKYDRSDMPQGNIYSFTNQSLSNYEFADYIDKRGSLIVTRDSILFIKMLLETNAADNLMAYENTMLEKKYPEFRYLMKEFHDGILLFEISNKKVWDRISHDSLGLYQYYENTKYNYLSKKQIDAKVYNLKVLNGEKMLASAYKKYYGKPDADKQLLEKFNRTNDTVLTINDGIWSSGDDPEIDSVEWIIGTHYFNSNGFPSIILIKEVKEPLPLEFKEVQEKMMTGYQEYLDNEWIRQLKEKYNVKIDSNVLEEVKKDLIDE